MGTIPFGSLWIVLQNLLTFFRSKPTTRWRNMRSFISPRLFVFMKFLSPLCRIEVLNLLLSFGKVSMMPWVPNSLLPQLIILRPVDKPSEWIKFLKICLDHVPLFMGRVGMNVYPLLNFLTIIVIKQVLECNHLKVCMGGVVELLSIGRNPENEYISVWILSWKPKRK